MRVISWRFSVVLLQKVLNWIQITGIRGADATKKTPTDTMPMGGQKREMLKRVNLMLTPLFYYCIPDANEKSEPVTPYGL